MCSFPEDFPIFSNGKIERGGGLKKAVMNNLSLVE